jgi:hypothetical protein
VYEPGWWGPGLRPEPPRPAGNRAWYIVGAWVTLMLVAAGYLVIEGLQTDPGDPGLADIAFVLSPGIAFAAAFSTTFLLALARAYEGVDLGSDTGTALYAHAIWVAPVAYLALLLVGAGYLDALHSTLAYGIMMYPVPVLLGAGSVLLLAIPLRHRSR